MWKSSVSGELRYLAGTSEESARPPKPTIRPRKSAIGKMTRSRKRSKETGTSSPAISSPASIICSWVTSLPARYVLQRAPLGAAHSRSGSGAGDRAPRRAGLEVAAGGSAGARLQRLLEEGRGEFQHVVEGGALLLALLGARVVRAGMSTPASRASRSTASGKVRPSVSIRKVKMSPFLPAEKSNQAPFWSLTKKEADLLLVEGREAGELAALLLELDAPPDHRRGGKPRLDLLEEVGRKAHVLPGDSGALLLAPL